MSRINKWGAQSKWHTREHMLNVTTKPVTNVVARPYIKTQHLSINSLFLKFESNGYITTISLENDNKVLSKGDKKLKFKLILNKKKQIKLDFYKDL